MMRTLRTALVIVVLYAIVVLGLTWPLAIRLTTHLPDTRLSCRVDGLLAGWTLAWETHALTTDPSRLLAADIYHPEPRPLFYGPSFAGALVTFAPVFLVTHDPTLALNVTFLAGVILTAAAIHWVASAWTGSQVAGALAGATFLATRWTLWWWIPTAPPLGMLVLLPLILRAAATGLVTTRGTVLLAVAIAAQGLVDVLYTTVAMSTVLGVTALARLARRESRANGCRLLGALGLGLAALLPVYAQHLDVARRNPDLANQTAWTIPELPVVLPTGLLTPRMATAVPLAALALVAAALVLRIVRRRADATVGDDAAWRQAALWAIGGLALSLGSIMLPTGGVLRSPHVALLAALGLEGGLRVRVRLGVVGLIGAAVLVGLAYGECRRRLGAAGRRVALAIAVVVATGMALEYVNGLPGTGRTGLPWGYPLFEPPRMSPTLAEHLRRAPGPLLELPVGAAGVAPSENARAMYRAIGHWQPLVNGYSGYFPRDFPDRLALARRFPDPDAIATLARETGLAWVLVRTGDLGFSPTRHVWARLADDPGAVPLRLVARDGTDLLFAVGPPSPPR